MEGAFGSDFSGVRVHTDTSAVQMNQELGAQAFTHGSDVYFNAGKYDTGSTEGKRLLGHELTHTVQQGSIGTKISRKVIQLQDEVEAGERQIDLHRGQGEARIDQAHRQAFELYSSATRITPQLATEVQQVIQQLTLWQRRYEADIDPRTLEQIFVGSIGGFIFGESVGMIADLWLPLKIGYKLVSASLNIGMDVREHYQLTEQLHQRTHACQLGDSTRDRILKAILEAQHAATHHVDVLWGAINEHASRCLGSGRQQRDQDMEQALAGFRQGIEERNLHNRDVRALEREGLQSIDAAERAEELLIGLRFAVDRLREVPFEFRQNSQLLLIQTELLFGQHGNTLIMEGSLRIDSSGSKYFSICRISSGQLRITTPINWTQLRQLGISVLLNLQLTVLANEPEIFTMRGADRERQYGSASSIQMDEVGNFFWGISDQDLGIFMTGPGNIPPRAGGWEHFDGYVTDRGVESETQREQAPTVGRLTKRQIRQILLHTPIQDLRGVYI